MKSTVARPNQPGPWKLLAKLTSITWLLIVLIFMARGYINAPPFEVAAQESCSELLIPVSVPVERLLFDIGDNRYRQLLHWKDGITGKELLPYRRGEKVLDCDRLDYHVASFLAASKKGIIVPTIGVNWGRLFLIIAIPASLMFIFCWLMAVLPPEPKKPLRPVS